MTDIRNFIRSLGPKAPEFFGTTEKTINRWLKSGTVPMKMVQKILAASQPVPEPAVQEKGVAEVPHQPDIDPVTHLPASLDRKLPVIQGQPPAMIEISPTEQSFGNNLTRPGRIGAPLPPMRIMKKDGQDVAYVPDQPLPPTVMPPTMIQDSGWSKPLEVKEKTDGKPKV